jgi:ubiquinone/menaquinone biosynthesis C-methylase UbiE
MSTWYTRTASSSRLPTTVLMRGGVNLFNDPDRALREFIRVAKKNGVVSWGDEGFSKNYKGKIRRRILAKLNPGFLKPMPDSGDTA